MDKVQEQKLQAWSQRMILETKVADWPMSLLFAMRDIVEDEIKFRNKNDTSNYQFEDELLSKE